MPILHQSDCGKPGMVTWTPEYGDIHMCQDNVVQMLDENERLNSEISDLEYERELLDLHIGELEMTLKRIPGALLHHLSGDAARRVRKDARRAVRLHRGPIFVWINHWQWVRVTKQEARQFIDRTFAERCVVAAETVDEDKVYLHVLSTAVEYPEGSSG